MATTPKVFKSAFTAYTVAGVIGQGGSGQVFSVKDDDGKEFALKCLFPDTATTEKRKRFRNEIFFCSKTQHANIIQVRDFGVVEWGKKECPFYVMTRYPTTLRKLINKNLPPADILPLFSQIMDGVEAAHLLGVIHRDLKPENVLVGLQNKHAVVADFGIAHFEEDILITSVETKDTARMANFCYSAPEQRLRGGTVDHRADIFALGLMLNEMFTGSVPQGEGYVTIEAVAPQYCYLDPLVEDMIQHNPDRRLSIKEIKEDLIGRRNAFVAQQELDTQRREVVVKSAPPRFEPIKLMAVSDYSNSQLSLQLNRQPENDWIQRFVKPREGYNSIGIAMPSQFSFTDAKAVIVLGDESNAQLVVDYFKRYLELANRGYQLDLVDRAQREAPRAISRTASRGGKTNPRVK